MYYKGSKAAVVVYDITVYVENIDILIHLFFIYIRKLSKVQKIGLFLKEK